MPNVRKFIYPLLLSGLLLCSAFLPANAQVSKIISGKVTDAKTGEVLPYVTVFVKVPNHANLAATTNFDGYYRLAIANKADSIYATYISYLPGKKAISKAAEQTIDFQLTQDVKLLNEVKVTPKSYINPAWEIMAAVVKHKPDNDLQKLQSYQYESYNRISVAVTNLSEKMKKRKVMKQIIPLMDSLKRIAGDDGTPVLPIFMSETISNFYYQNTPRQKTEQVLRTKVNGVGIEDETLISQIVGSSFQQYNFYENYLRLANKDFLSPLTDSWKTFYNYELVNTNDRIDGKDYYRIEFKPKRAHDLSFVGVMWITHDSYALYRMDASVSPDANLDFLNKVRIQQQMAQPAGTTAWIPEKVRIVLHISSLKKDWSGFIGNFYLSNKNFEVNKTYPKELFKEPLTMADDVTKKDDFYWLAHRQDTLTAADRRVYQMIDTVKNLPIVKTYADIVGMLINGYYKGGKFSYGPYLYTYGYNDLEGSVIRFGGTTNKDFSDKLILSGYASYGFKTKNVNYNGAVDYILSRKPWTQAGLSYQHDIAQTGYQFENFSKSNNVFNASIRNGSLTKRGPYLQNDIRGYIQTDLERNLRGKLSFSNRSYVPFYDFEYQSPTNGQTFKSFYTTEVIGELQWTPGRRQLQSAKINKRIVLGTGTDNPIVTLRYLRGVNFAGGDFNYNKYYVNVQQKLHMGIFGKGEYSFTGGYIPASLPNLLLENHRYAFNTMRFLEYSSDRFVSINYTQHMEGLITNSLPLLKSLNMRTVVDINILEGSLAESNNRAFTTGRSKLDRSLEGIPYVEAGYGVENVLKFLRFDLLYRVTHKDHLSETGLPPSNFAFRTSIQFRL